MVEYDFSLDFFGEVCYNGGVTEGEVKHIAGNVK